MGGGGGCSGDGRDDGRDLIEDQLDLCGDGGRYRGQFGSSSGWWGVGSSEVAELHVGEHAQFGVGSSWEQDLDPQVKVGEGLTVACGAALDVVGGVDGGINSVP